MTSNTRVPRTEINGIYGGLLKVAMRKMLGGVPEGAEVLWHHPVAFKDLMKFGGRTEYAEAMCQTSPTVTDELSAALLEQLGAPAPSWSSPPGVGTMNLTARANVALGIRSQEYAEACGLEPLAARTKAVVFQP